MKKNNDTKDYSEQLEFLNSEPYYASKTKIVNQSSDFPVRRTGSYRHKKSTANDIIFSNMTDISRPTQDLMQQTAQTVFKQS